MQQSREQHRQAAIVGLAAAQAEGDVTKTNKLLEALTQAVLALSAPSTADLEKSGNQQQTFDALSQGLRRR